MKKYLSIALVSAVMLSATPAAARAQTPHDVFKCVFYSDDILECLFG